MFTNKILFLFSILVFSLSANAGGPQAASMAQGGFVKNTAISALTVPNGNLPNRVFLRFGSANIVNNGYYGAYSLSGTGQYHLAASQKLECEAMHVGSATPIWVVLGYSTATFTEGTTAAPTGLQCYEGGTCPNQNGGLNFPANSGAVYDAYPWHASWTDGGSGNTYPLIYFTAATANNAYYIFLDCVVQ